MSATTIEWTDTTWNPVRGCTKVSPGCAHCYAETFAERFRGVKGHPYEQGFDLRLVPEKLVAPLSWKKPRRVFVNSMSDLFHEDVPNEYIAAVFGVMAACPQHTFQVLTKRAWRLPQFFAWLDEDGSRPRLEVVWQALREEAVRIGDAGPMHTKYCADPAGPWPLPNVWVGVSVENQHFADERIPLLLQTPAAVRFISAEPLLGPVDIGMSSATCSCCRRWPSRWVHVHREVRPQFPLNLAEGAEKVVAPVGIHRAQSNQHGALAVGEMGLIPSDFTALPGLDWVIVGGESGHGARPFDIAWARNIVSQCTAANVPVFIKQLGVNWFDQVQRTGVRGSCVVSVDAPWTWVKPSRAKGGDMAEWPEDLRVRQFPEAL